MDQRRASADGVRVVVDAHSWERIIKTMGETPSDLSRSIEEIGVGYRYTVEFSTKPTLYILNREYTRRGSCC